MATPAQKATPYALKLQNVSKVYSGRVKALTELDLEVRSGEMCFIVGPSGAGKSTLLALITAQERPTVGKIEVVGYDVHSMPERKIPLLRRQIGFIFQDFKLLEERTVEENVRFPLEIRGEPSQVTNERTKHALQLVGLLPRRKHFPDELSGGERQRAAIARAIVSGPRLLLADEPTGNLDPATSGEIMSLLDAIHRLGTTIILATHDPALYAKKARRTIALTGGRKLSDEIIDHYPTHLLATGDRR